MAQKIRWGFLSTANITKALIEPLRTSKRNSLLAIASRDQSRAGAFGKKYKIPRAYGSYEDLLNDPDVDVIYNPLPNHLHAEWTVKAVKAGKNVLCEKPLALSVEEVDSISNAAGEHGKVVAEALMYRSHASTKYVREIIQDGKLGEVRLVRGSFTYSGTKPGDFRLSPEMGGGALWDIGIYPLSYTRFVLDNDPMEAFGWQTLGSTGVDESFVAQLKFPGNTYLQMDCSTVCPYHVFMEIVGTEAALVVPQPFNPTPKENLYLTRKGKHEMIPVKGTGTYVGEVEAMADSILEGAPPAVTLEDSRKTIFIIQQLFVSANSGKPVALN